MNQPYVRVLGSADWHVTKNNDHSCYTLSDKALIDACPSVVMQLLNNDIEPSEVPVIFFTHLHADHYMGLAALLHNRRVCNFSLKGLTIVGPKATLRAAYERAMDYVFCEEPGFFDDPEKLPELVELEGRGTIRVGDWEVEYTDSLHAVPGLCYRFTDVETGHVACFSGDTDYRPVYAELFREADLLFYECSYGAGPLTGGGINNHSSAEEAVCACREANVRRLMLTHTYEPKRAAALEVARAGLSIPVEWAMPGKVFEF